MAPFPTRTLPATPDAIAPDGSEVRVLAGRAAGGMACFRLAPGQVARAVTHRSVEEIWYVVEGAGEIWRARDGVEEVMRLQPGVSLAIPLGTTFQFRAQGTAPLSVIAVTMPPWPGENEAIERLGPWTPTV
ncbi:MAG: cupin domain-containing protein [Chloroflexi bacterium]|nr:cupin domain-containing protein [Chloroflexota bacterium]